MTRKHKIERVGLITGGGDCPGLNAAIRAVVRTAIERHSWEVTGFLDGYEGLVEDRWTPLTYDRVAGIIARGGTILGTSNRADPFHYNLPGQKNSGNRVKDLLGTVHRHQLDALIVIGGDGTLTSASKLHKLGVRVIGIPKTIDNDLKGTDVTIGFDSALTIATESIDRLHSTAEAHHRVMVVEVMGRYAGWIALRSGMAGGGDVILLPEIPYSLQCVSAALESRLKRGKRFSIVVVAEGAHPKKGKMIIDRMERHSPDPVRLGGIGKFVARQLDTAGFESRVTVLGHLQRGGAPTAFDRWIATQFGVMAVSALADGKSGHMVAVRRGEVVTIPLANAIRKLHRVDPKGAEVQAAMALGTSFGV